MADDNDIPSLPLKVLQNIQAELVGLRGDIKGLDKRMGNVEAELVGLRGEVRGLDTRMGSVETELKIINSRFDNFLQFVGKDVSELKERLGRLEKHAGLP